MPESIHDAHPRPPDPLLLLLACVLSNAAHFTTQPLAFVSVTLSLGRCMRAHFVHHPLSKTSNRDRLSIPEFPYLLSVWYLCKNVPLSGFTHSSPTGTNRITIPHWGPSFLPSLLPFLISFLLSFNSCVNLPSLYTIDTVLIQPLDFHISPKDKDMDFLFCLCQEPAQCNIESTCSVATS